MYLRMHGKAFWGQPWTSGIVTLSSLQNDLGSYSVGLQLQALRSTWKSQPWKPWRFYKVLSMLCEFSSQCFVSSDNFPRSFAEFVGFSSFVTCIPYLPSDLMLSRACCSGLYDSRGPVSFSDIYVSGCNRLNTDFYHPLVSLA